MIGFASDVFKVEQVEMGGTTEMIVRGGRDKFPLLGKALTAIKQIGVIGWGSQAPAQAPNLRESLAGTGINVKVGLREGSEHVLAASQAGFTRETNTLGEMFQVIGESDLVLLLIRDDAQVEHYKRIFESMRPGTILGLSHGFLLGYLDSVGERFPKHISVIGVCPKGMGPSVRRLYEQGKTINGAGINCNFAVEQDRSFGAATDVALAWAIAIGAPVISQTTLGNEWRSDLFGERAVLLAGTWGFLEATYRRFVMEEWYKAVAFQATVENVTGPRSSIISKEGILGVYNHLNKKDRLIFERVFSCAYQPFSALLDEIYQEVASGNEIRSVVMAGNRLRHFPMTKIGNTDMWLVGEKFRAEREFFSISSYTNPITAALYCAMMMAQIAILLAKGHPISEICNESVIEAVDSLNPYMHLKGVAHMVDNCSTTARIGTRKWGPRWDYATQQVFTSFDGGAKTDLGLIEEFKTHRIHGALAVCSSMRPPVDISVTG